MGNKKCYICGHIKNTNLFVEYKITNNKICKICKDCNDKLGKYMLENRETFNKLFESTEYFYNNYNLIFSYNLNLDYKKPIIISDPDKKCRFCGKKEPEVTFKKKAHAISEMLGNKVFLSDNECDQCNMFFGNELENDLGKYLGLIRTLTQTEGKKKVPAYKTKDNKARIDFIPNKGYVIIQQEGSEFLDLENKGIIFEKEPYSPIKVYKAFVKMALSILPYQFLDDFSETLCWLKKDTINNDVDKIFDQSMTNYAYLIERFIPGHKPLDLKVTGLLRKNNNSLSPYYYFIIEFNNYCYQIMIPCIKRDTILLEHDIKINIFPIFYDFFPDKIKITTNIKNMKNKNKIKEDKLIFPLNFGKIEIFKPNEKNLENLLKKEGISIKLNLKPKEKK